MTDDDFRPIRPKPVSLAHVAGPTLASAPRGRPRWTAAAAFAVAGALLVAVFVVAPRLVQPPSTTAATAPSAASAPAASSPAGTPTDPQSATPPRSAPDQAAPFEQLQRDQARTAAQAALSRFVELQLKLEQSMQVGAWGSTALQSAKDRATAGDDAFVREDFAAAVQNYQGAAADLEALIAQGSGILEQAIVDGTTALRSRDPEAARNAFSLAATIAPDDARVKSGAARAERLPRVNELMRTARNQELSGDWNAALASLRDAQGLDPDTDGLAEALGRVNAGAGHTRLQSVLSAAFAYLDAGRLDEARAAFQDALRLDPNNASARGGLEQVGRQAELSRLDRLQQQAERAIAEERWADAEAIFTEALALDPNVQFAIAGRGLAHERQQAAAALTAIIGEPDRLSSEQSYAAARATLAAAEALDPKGPALEAQIAQVRNIVETYATPVPVLLRSDNRTQITVSTVGPLGTFSEKQLTLRPGAYTVIGSRDGCRDIRERILVRPDMAPVDIRCVEAL